MQIALKNNKVMRNIGGQVQGPPDFITAQPGDRPDDLRSGLGREQSSHGHGGGVVGVRRPIAARSLTWEKIDTPQNVNPVVYAASSPT